MRKSRERLVVAIDGPAGAGKSSAAEAVAARLGYVRVDTGALYRAVAWAAKERGLAWSDPVRMGELADSLPLHFRTGPAGSALVVDGAPRGLALRTAEISEGASIISRYPQVRKALLGIQRRLGTDGGVVLEGRDIGTVVFPDADVKVFLTASPEERARRRLAELLETDGDADYQQILKRIRERDARDTDREVAPLRPAEDAIVVDGTALSLEEVVALIVDMVERTLGPAEEGVS